MLINKETHEFLLPDQRAPASLKQETTDLKGLDGLKAKYINGSGMRYEVEEVARCITQGWIESPLMNHEEMLTIARITQMVKEEIDLSYHDLYKNVE
jgi:hypothetical protein